MKRTYMHQWFCLLATALLSAPAAGFSTAELQTQLDARFKGDRTGACVVAAVIDKGQVTRGKTCARPRADGGPGYDSVFEIGSVTKTMTAFLVADLIRQGKWSLDDALAKHLPPGTVVPQQGARQIQVRDALAHTSGLPALPPGFSPKDPSDPYADLSEKSILLALGKVQLSRPIGSQFEYSNFAMMLVSLAVARGFGTDYEAALAQRLFAPLKMDGAYVERPRAARPRATGHLPSGQPTSDWHTSNNLAGVGMVRASLDDMVLYAQAHLGRVSTEIWPSLELTQKQLHGRLAMNWMLVDVQGRHLVAHEGGTGGFSSLVALEPNAQRAVVILADTGLSDLGGLNDLGNALLGVEAPRLQPRLPATPSLQQLAALLGEYELAGMKLKIWLDGKRLMARAEGQSAFELKYDSAGDFYPEGMSALLTPQWVNGRVNLAVWRQGGGAMEVTRKGTKPPSSATDPRWKDLAGEYTLLPQFTLRVFEEAGVLKVQGTGQPAISAELTGADTISIKTVGAVVKFKRDASGQVVRAVLEQGGQTIEGKRKGDG